ncbi:MAG: hypothetical protein ACR2RE_15205 [Geminicoccaceae bacterium]
MTDQMNPPKRKPGRPRGSGKKGKSSWKPAQKLSLYQKQPGFRYRWCDKSDPQNLAKKEAEGWFYVNPETGAKAEHDNPGDSGASLTRASEYRELVLMALPESVAKERDAFFREKTRSQTASIEERARDDAKKRIGPEAEVEPNLVIE